MGILERVHVVQLHREVYIAILDSVLRTPGSKRHLAKQIGITPQYLSFLLNTQTDNPYSFRPPSFRVAEKIANALPLPSEQRLNLLKHMYLAGERASQVVDTLRSELPARPIEDYLGELRKAHDEATFAIDAQRAKTLYLTVRDISQVLLKHSVLYTYPLHAVEVCMILHDAQCVLNCAEDALYLAKLARAIMSSLDRCDYRDKERFDSFQIRSFRAEAVAYGNLQLFREAYDCCLQAERSEAMRYQFELALPQLNRDKIKALYGQPRFALSEAEELAIQVRKICDRGRDELDPLWVFLVNQFLGRAYLQYHNLKKAGKLLRAQFEQMERIPHLGPLHRTMFLKTYAWYRYDEGDYIEWEHLITKALKCAFNAGLTHQISEMRQEYGSVLQTVLKELEQKELTLIHQLAS